MLLGVGVAGRRVAVGAGVRVAVGVERGVVASGVAESLDEVAVGSGVGVLPSLPEQATRSRASAAKTVCARTERSVQPRRSQSIGAEAALQAIDAENSVRGCPGALSFWLARAFVLGLGGVHRLFLGPALVFVLGAIGLAVLGLVVVLLCQAEALSQLRG